VLIASVPAGTVFFRRPASSRVSAGAGARQGAKVPHAVAIGPAAPVPGAILLCRQAPESRGRAFDGLTPGDLTDSVTAESRRATAEDR
jgi:hypothetical protein